MEPGTLIADWDAFSIPIVSELGGQDQVGDIIEGVTMQERVDKITGKASKVITPAAGSRNLNPRYHH